MTTELEKLAETARRANTRSSSFLLFVIISLIGAIVFWAAVTEVDKVIRGDGKTISEGENQLVQTSESGVLLKRYIEEGDVVKSGDVLFDIDPVDARTEYQQSLSRAYRLKVQKHRLQSEAKESRPDFTTFDASELSEFVEGQKSLFEAKKNDLDGSIAILTQRRIQKDQQIDELNEDIESSYRIAELLEKEISILRPLVLSGISPETKLLSLLREQEQTSAKVSSARFNIKRLQAQLREISEQINVEQQSYITSAFKELSEVSEALSETQVIIPSLAARLARTSIYSPIDGIVNQVNFQTEKAYTRSGEVLLEIVPTGEDLVVEARIDPKDIADVILGDIVKISLTAYDPTRYGRLDGRVQKISADAITDKQDGRTYYAVRTSIDSALYENENKEVVLLPGMVATIDIISGKRTILDYIWQPIARTKDRALRD
jgi:adhesin transport system membrane fusion protein